MKTGDPFLIWVWARHSAISGWIWRLEDQRRGGSRGRSRENSQQRIIPCINNYSLPAPIGFAHFSSGGAVEPIERKEDKKRCRTRHPIDAGSGAKRVPFLSAAAAKWRAMIYPLARASHVQCQDACSCSPGKKVNKRRHVHCC